MGDPVDISHSGVTVKSEGRQIKDITHFPYLNRDEFSQACRLFLPYLHRSQIESKLLFEEDCYTRTDSDLVNMSIRGIEALLSRKINEDQTLYIKVHVLLSDTHNVPTLYFTAFLQTSDGENLYLTLLDDIYKYVVKSDKEAILRNSTVFGLSKGAISQTEHPIFHTSLCFYVHPCNTTDVLNIFAKDLNVPNITLERYMILWIGIIGDVVGLSIKV
ncbi:hypothetical protein V1511DRAFT_497025 [Dipodascopsis uninucleata]